MSPGRTLTRSVVGLALGGGIVLCACHPEGAAPGERPRLLPLPAPPALETLDPQARRQLGERQAVVEDLLQDPGAADRRLGRAFGELGKVYHAYRYMEEALVCYRDARLLDRSERAWAYYLGHTARALGETGAAEEAFRAALELRPGDVPSVVWLAETELDQGHLEAAEELFRQALAEDPRCARARLGLGRIALERQRFATAVEELEAARELQPRASEVHYALGLAYRGAGDPERAAEHFARVSTDHLRPRSVAMDDPLLAAVEALAGGAMAHEHRGLRAAARGDFQVAAVEFEQAVSLDPGRHDARHNLALALLRIGRRDEAVGELEALLEADPGHTPSRVLLAGVLAEEGSFEAAERHLRAAVEADPGSTLAHLRLGDLLLRTGRPEQALACYTRARELDPARGGAHLGVAAARLRQREYGQAAEGLQEAVAGLPGDRSLRRLLARLRAAAPEAAVRDGRRALELAREAGGGEGVAGAETLAMALAEVGRFAEAARWQRRALDALDPDGEAAGRARRRLALYERGAACRVPWEEGEEL